MLLVVGLVAAGGAILVGFDVSVDPYGLYHDTHGQRRLVYGDDRVGKYLLNARYVPDNFNAILIGTSVSGNWDMTGVEKLRIYNESLNGGNIVEEKAIAEQALSKPGVAVALLIVFPYLTSSHDFATVRLEPSLRLSALGSENLLETYGDMIDRRLHHPSRPIDDMGTLDFGQLAPQLNPVLQKLFRPGLSFDVDPVALKAYRDLVAELRAGRVQIIFIVPPVFEGLLQTKQAAFRSYSRLIRATMAPDDLVIDFTSQEFAPFRNDRSNFGDGVHLFPKSGEIVVSQINTRINRWIENGRLWQPPLPR
jgi:hypothetical protein